MRNGIGNVRKNEENFEEMGECRNLSPIEEESESMLCFKDASTSFNEPKGNNYRMIPSKDYQRMLRKSEGNVHCELREN